MTDQISATPVVSERMRALVQKLLRAAHDKAWLDEETEERALLREIAALEADAARLEWLVDSFADFGATTTARLDLDGGAFEEDPAQIFVRVPNMADDSDDGWTIYDGATWRDAVDAAMRGETSHAR